MKSMKFFCVCVIVTYIVILAFLTQFLFSCEKPDQSSDKNTYRQPNDGEVNVLYTTGKETIYIKVFEIDHNYTSHVVWIQDSTGHITSIATH